MKIDFSRYDAFTRNPEKYRLTYERNLVPNEIPFALARGLVMHSAMEAHNRQLNPVDTKALIAENNVSHRAESVGLVMADALKRRYVGDARFEIAKDAVGNPYVESEFDIPIPGSPHSLIGRRDVIMSYKDHLWLVDYKSANAKASETKKKIEFATSYQPIFYINASRLQGIPVEGMLYLVVTEHNPPQFYEIESRRTDHQLEMGLIHIHQVAEMIQMMRKTFGVDMPWPHYSFNWPCNSDKCDYRSICGRMDLTPDDLTAFKHREDHLELMRSEHLS